VETVADVRLDRQGAADTVLLMVRGDGEELASLRVDDQRRLRVSAIGDRETTSLRIEPGAWYRATIVADPAKKTVSMSLRNARGRVLIERSDLGWRSPESIAVDGLCFAPSQGRSGLGMTFDAVRVTRIP
jgi:hypothetical protein